MHERHVAPIPTELELKIIAYVNECAAHFFEGTGRYRECGPTLNQIAQHLSKTPRQITAALWRLIQGGFVTIEEEAVDSSHLNEQLVVFPSKKSLLAHPHFADMQLEDIDDFIGRLKRPKS